MDEVTTQPVLQGAPRVSTATQAEKRDTQRFLLEQPVHQRSVAKPSAKTDKPAAGLRKSTQKLKTTAESVSLTEEMIGALQQEINDGFVKVATKMAKDPQVQKAAGRVLSGEIGRKKAASTLCKTVGKNLVDQLGVDLVNEALVKESLHLLLVIGKKLGIEEVAGKAASAIGAAVLKEGTEKVAEVASKVALKEGAEKVAEAAGKAVLKEGAEVALKEGTKVGAKKGIMGVLSSVPLANVIPMLFTGAELVSEFCKEEPNKKSIGKSLAVFGLQLGALVFPPLGLVATAVDVTGSVAIAVSDAKADGKTAEERQAIGREAAAARQGVSAERDAAVQEGSGAAAQMLKVIAKLFEEHSPSDNAEFSSKLGSYAASARKLAEKANEVGVDEARANELSGDIGQFGFEVLVPFMLEKAGLASKTDDKYQGAWKNISDGLRGLKSTYDILPQPGEKALRSDRAEHFIEHLFRSLAQLHSGAQALGAEPN